MEEAAFDAREENRTCMELDCRKLREERADDSD
jgi:hypothetical protein